MAALDRALPRVRLALNRQVWVWVHRWLGLASALFLALAGLTGALLAWNEELDSGLAPQLWRAPARHGPAALAIDPLQVRERLAREHPDAWAFHVPLHAEPGRALLFQLEGPTDPATGEHAELPDDQFFIDPATGRELGRRHWGDITQGTKNLMPFVYRLHYSLAAGTWGYYAMGVVALIWTIDCFVGLYLTFPVRRARVVRAGGGTAMAGPRGWFARWQPAWKIRRARGYKLNVDLHRAGGLWVWAMLLVIAWSSVAFNLQQVYYPVTSALLETHNPYFELPLLDRDQSAPEMPWERGLAEGRRLMAEAAREQGFSVRREDSLRFDPHRGLFVYTVVSDRDLSHRFGQTAVFFDAASGARRAVMVPTGRHAGTTLTVWLMNLHMAQVWGLPFRVFVCAMGLVVAMLSGTGVVIWWAKRRGRSQARRMGSPRA